MESWILGPREVWEGAPRFCWFDPEISLEQTEVKEALAETISELTEREKLVASPSTPRS